MKMQTCGRLIKDVERAAGIALGQLQRELDALRLAAGERGRGLSQREVTEADRVECGEFVDDARDVAEKREGLADRHVEHVGDRPPVEQDLERLAVEAPSPAARARRVSVGEELHVELDRAVALAQQIAANAPVALAAGEGFIKVIGEVGTGKTLLCRKLLAGLGPQWVCAYIPNPDMGANDLFRAVAQELGVHVSKRMSRYAMLEALRDILGRFFTRGLVVEAFAVAGFILALALVARLMSEKRAPASTDTPPRHWRPLRTTRLVSPRHN
mgnify:CR=1 FL=1